MFAPCYKLICIPEEGAFFSETGPDQSRLFSIAFIVDDEQWLGSIDAKERRSIARGTSIFFLVLCLVATSRLEVLRLRCRGLIILMDITIVLASWRSPLLSRADIHAKSEQEEDDREEEKAARVSASATWYRRGFTNDHGTAPREHAKMRSTLILLYLLVV